MLLSVDGGGESEVIFLISFHLFRVSRFRDLTQPCLLYLVFPFLHRDPDFSQWVDFTCEYGYSHTVVMISFEDLLRFSIKAH